jgi:hypothetical protein
VDAFLGVVVTVATAGALLRYGLGQLRRNWAFARRAVRAPGRILCLWAGWGGDVLLRYPLLGYETPAGRPVVTPSLCGGFPGPLRAGRAVTVLYDPAAPDDACLASRWLLWGQPLLAALLGGLWLALLAACALGPALRA